MNINLEIKVDSPELMTAILRLAEALPQLSLGSFSLSEGEKKLELITPVEGASEGVSKEFLREAIKEKPSSEGQVSSKGDLETIKALLKKIYHKDKMVEVLSKYGAKKVSQLQEKDYKFIIKDLEECICQLSAN